MTIAFDNAGTVATGDNVTTLGSNAPSSVATGDLLVMIGAFLTNPTLNAVTGWTNRVNAIEVHNTSRTAIWDRIADGSATDTPTVTWTTSNDAKLVILRFTGNSATPYDTEGHAGEYFFTTPTLSSLTTAETDEIAIAVANNNTGNATSTPSGWTQRVDSANGGGVDVGLRVWTRAAATVTSYGGQTFTSSGSVGKCPIIAYKSAAAVGAGMVHRRRSLARSPLLRM